MGPATRPFCSDRCRLADLGRWLSEDYRVPGHAPDAAPDDDGDEGARAAGAGRDSDTDD
jgi:endogenous inhibitor of DNA gyrase (YacG/DUF329 family)